MVERIPKRYRDAVALNIKDPVAEQLAAEVAALTGQSKTGAVRTALRRHHDELTAASVAEIRRTRVRRFLVDEAWPQVPVEVRTTPMTKDEREAVLGYGPEGV